MFNLRPYWRRERDSRLGRRARLTAKINCCQVGGRVRRPKPNSIRLASPQIPQFSCQEITRPWTKAHGRVMAQRKGFEPLDSCPSTVFKTAAFDRSAISACYLIFMRAGDAEHSSYRTRMRYRFSISACYLVFYESGRCGAFVVPNAYALPLLHLCVFKKHTYFSKINCACQSV